MPISRRGFLRATVVTVGLFPTWFDRMIGIVSDQPADEAEKRPLPPPPKDRRPLPPPPMEPPPCSRPAPRIDMMVRRGSVNHPCG